MNPLVIAAGIALGGAVLLGGKKKTKRRSTSAGTGVYSGSWAVKGNEDRRHWLNEIRSMSQWYSNRYESMPFLADYLTVVGYIESNFNPAAVNKGDPNQANAARGLGGMRPETAFKEKYGTANMAQYPNALLNPRWAFVMSVHHIWWACTRVYDRQSGVVDWAAIRRWWGIPERVHDFNFDYDYSQGNLERFEAGLHKCNDAYGTNIDPDFVWVKIKGWDRYPGIAAMIDAFDLEGVHA